MTTALDAIAQRLDAATGADRELDRALAEQLSEEDGAADYTASVDRCIDLVRARLPGWAWHVGWNASGVLPYATLHRQEHLVAAAGPTVPLALLKALLRALLAEQGAATRT